MAIQFIYSGRTVYDCQHPNRFTLCYGGDVDVSYCGRGLGDKADVVSGVNILGVGD